MQVISQMEPRMNCPTRPSHLIVWFPWVRSSGRLDVRAPRNLIPGSHTSLAPCRQAVRSGWLDTAMKRSRQCHLVRLGIIRRRSNPVCLHAARDNLSRLVRKKGHPQRRVLASPMCLLRGSEGSAHLACPSWPLLGNGPAIGSDLANSFRGPWEMISIEYASLPERSAAVADEDGVPCQTRIVKTPGRSAGLW